MWGPIPVIFTRIKQDISTPVGVRHLSRVSRALARRRRRNSKIPVPRSFVHDSQSTHAKFYRRRPSGLEALGF